MKSWPDKVVGAAVGQTPGFIEMAQVVVGHESGAAQF
jgi:hypothetical protein